MSINKSADYIGDELTLFANATNWKHYWSNKLEPLLADSVLEVGAGIGTNLSLLRRRDQTWTALEPDAKQAQIISESIPEQDRDKVTVLSGTLADINDGEMFDSIIYIDVLEHIENDKSEVESAMSHLNTGGRLIILSPAHQRLFSPFDKTVGHFRRYNKATISALTAKSASIEKLFYLDSIGCFASLANATLLEASMPTEKQIWIWDKLMVPISKIIDKLCAHKIGKTIVMVWQKT
jgi:2-polyprenyl-3-methyl-5-hydroxy-6-metoxy-1,4-benzoquinol methylase